MPTTCNFGVPFGHFVVYLKMALQCIRFGYEIILLLFFIMKEWLISLQSLSSYDGEADFLIFS